MFHSDGHARGGFYPVCNAVRCGRKWRKVIYIMHARLVADFPIGKGKFCLHVLVVGPVSLWRYIAGVEIHQVDITRRRWSVPFYGVPDDVPQESRTNPPVR